MWKTLQCCKLHVETPTVFFIACGNPYSVVCCIWKPLQCCILKYMAPIVLYDPNVTSKVAGRMINQRYGNTPHLGEWAITGEETLNRWPSDQLPMRKHATRGRVTNHRWGNAPQLDEWPSSGLETWPSWTCSQLSVREDVTTKCLTSVMWGYVRKRFTFWTRNQSIVRFVTPRRVIRQQQTNSQRRNSQPLGVKDLRLSWICGSTVSRRHVSAGFVTSGDEV